MMSRRGRRAHASVVLVLAMVLLGPAPEARAVTPTTLVPVSLEQIQIAQGVTVEGAEITFDGTNFLIVWNAGALVYGARLSPDGVVLAPGIITLHDSGYDPSVAFDGTNFFVTWADATGGSDTNAPIEGVRVSTAGVVLDPTPIVVARNTKLRPTPVAFDGTNFIVVWRTLSDDVQMAHVSPAGTPLDGDTGVNIGYGFYPQVSCENPECLVVWHTHGTELDVYGRVVHADGSLGVAFPISAETANQHHTSVATDGSSYFVVWQDARAGNQENHAGVYGSRVTAAGAVLDDPAIVVSKYHWSQGNRPSTAFDGTDYVATWSQSNYPVNHRLSDIYLRRVSTAGAFVDAEPLPVATGFGHQGEPVVGVAGDRFVVTYTDYSDPCPWPSACVGLRLFDRVAAGPSGAVSTDEAPVASTWQRLTSPIEGAIHTVHAFGDVSAFAGTEPDGPPPFDQNPLLQWNGSSWSVTTMLPNSRKYGMWGTGPNHLFSTGGFGGMVLWDGSTGVIGANLFNSTGPLTDMGTEVTGFGDWSTFFSGIDGVVARYTGHEQLTWQNGACASWDDGTSTDYGLWDCERIRGTLDNWDIGGPAPNDAWTVGEFGTLAHFNGTDWSLVDVPVEQSLNGVWGSCGGDVFVVGDYGTILHYDGSTWTEQDSPTTENLYAVAGFDGSHVYAVGNTGTILKYDGSTWTREDSGTDNTLEDVAVGETFVWAVGSRDDDWNGIGQGTILKKEVALPDVTPPENPFLASHTHKTGAWTSNDTISITIEGGCDDGRGIDGFSYVLDGSPSTIPDEIVDLDTSQRTFTSSPGDGIHYFHLRTRDRAGNWSAATHLGPLQVDVTPPTLPVLVGSDPAPGGWDNDGSFRVDWSGVTDAMSGVGGYSWTVDQSPISVPGVYGNLDASATGVDVGATPGDWYVHLRAVDGANSGVTEPGFVPDCEGWPCGNWSDPVHIGPFRFDGAPPTNPALSSPSHTIDTPSGDDTVQVTLSGASDDASGVDGFSYAWSQCAGCDPGEVKQVEETTASLTSPPLANGEWWLQVRTVDNAGNWSPETARIGPFVIVPQTFDDVPPAYWAYFDIETIAGAGITTGCSATPPLYCPGASVDRAQMAVFLVRAMGQEGSLPPYQGYFLDVPAGQWYTPYVERLYQLGVTTGCATSPLRYCPAGLVSRAQMALFLLRAMGEAGHLPSYRGLFADVPASNPYARSIEHLYDHAITGGCASAPLRYCPGSSVTRAQMAAFLVRAFGL